MKPTTPGPADRLRTHGSDAGFNLIEVMVALGILAFGILAIASMQESSLLGTSRAFNVTDGTTEAMDQMETLITRAYTNPDLNDGDHVPVVSGRYTTNWTVTEDAPNRIKTITVTVNWTEAGGAAKSTSLTCIKNRI